MTMDKRYKKSQAMLERALKVIPLGSQTFSKSITQWPEGVSPHFISMGNGSRVWDVDGNEYIDFINSLASVILGYNDPDVLAAVREQLEKGTIFSLSHELEIEVAEKITEMVPCAEMVRFGKNGSDATAGAIRLARAYTGKDHVIMCGYHGWQDWCIGTTTRDLGVPKSVSSLTHTFKYNDIDSLASVFARHPGEVAAVIMEPANALEPEPGFLEEVRELSHKNNALFILDETVTGFRYSNGGAQEYFNITPDLATFGKGLANGYPLSAIAGKAEVMRLMKDIFFSFTFGGEALSLAAAKATLEKLRKEPVVETLWTQGRKVSKGVKELIKKHCLEGALAITGKDCWTFLIFKDTESYPGLSIKTLYQQEILSRGILAIGSHNMSYAHSDKDIEILLAVYDEVFALIGNSIAEGSLQSALRTRPLAPLFKIR